MASPPHDVPPPRYATRPPDAGRAVAWGVLALLGQGAILTLTRAGRTVGYQHFVPLGAASPWRVVAATVLLLQLVVVTRALMARRAAVRETLRTLAPGWRAPAIVAAMVLTSATLSRHPATYAAELLLAGSAQLVQLATVALAAAAWPVRWTDAFARAATRVLGDGGDGGGAPAPGGPDRFAYVTAGVATVVALALTLFVYERHPHIPDEVAYLVQARYLAQGVLALPAPPVPEAFSLDLMTLDQHGWYSIFPPGWPAMLAIGVRLGSEWFLNPLLAGANVLLAYVALRAVFPLRTARIAVLLLAVSPWSQFMAMSLMSHTFTLTCMLLAATGVARLRANGTVAWALASGVALGMMSLIRPLDAAIVAGLLGLWSLGARWRGVPLVPSALMTASAAAVGALNLWYNRALTGDARTFPVMLYFDRLFGKGSNDLGFGPNRDFGWRGLDPFPGHGPIDVVINSNMNLFQVNTELLGWGCGSLVLVWWFLAAGRRARADWAMIVTVVAIVAAQNLYWFSGGPDFGARYWFLMIVPTIVLVARGLEEADVAIRRTGARSGVLEPALLLTGIALLTFAPWRAVDKYYHYRGMRPDIRTLQAQRSFGGALVLVRGNRHPDYHSAAVYNTVPLDDPRAPIYAWDRGTAERAKLVAAFPDRPVWIVDGPSITGDAFRVQAGPLTAAQALALP